MRKALTGLLIAAGIPHASAAEMDFTISSANGGSQSLVSWTISGALASQGGYLAGWSTNQPGYGTGWSLPVATPLFATSAERNLSVAISNSTLALYNISTGATSTNTVLHLASRTGQYAGEDVWFSFDLAQGSSDHVRVTSTSGSAVIDIAFSEFNPGSYNVGYMNWGSVTVAGAAVPEPSTYGLLLGGLALAGAVVRRRRSK